MYKKIALFLLILSLGGCGYKTTELKSKSYIVSFKLENLRFSDVGFINRAKNYTNLQVFTAGTPIINLKIHHQICVDLVCKTKEEFKKEYLCEDYPDELFEKVLNGKKILNSKNLEKTKDGFAQFIRTPKYNIIYKVTNSSIYFKDTINAILIKLREVNE